MCISTPRSNLVVRFLSVFLLCCTSLYASTDQTGKQKVTVVGTDVTLGEVFKQIERQTGLRFMYAVDAVDVKEKVTVAFEKVMLDEVLDSLLGRKGVEWIYRVGVISLKKGTNLSVNDGPISIIEPSFTISGRVLDVKGNPIPGATITIKGTKKGTKADGDGHFTLAGVSINAILLISSVGFETIELAVEQKNITIRMKDAIGILDTKIIIGYGTTTNRRKLGSITSITADEIARSPVSDPILALQGRVPGMIITQTTGLPGGQLKVQIRGRNSINNGTQPLFVVDGVPYQPNIMAPPLANYGALGEIISALNFINPTDIESIDVLRDADATAIYGTRGANGVVLITTKRGKIGETVVSINLSKGVQNIAKRREMLNTPQYIEMRREAFKNDNIVPNIDNAPDLLVWDTTRYTDWQKELIGGTAQYSDMQASVSGGVTSVQYLLGGNYHKETTIYPGDFGSQRGGAHFSLTGNSQDQKLKASLTGNYSLGKSDFPGGDFAGKIGLAPNAPKIYNSDGILNWENSTWENPYAQLVSNILDSKTTNLVANIDLSYQIIPNLIAKGNIGYNELRTNSFSASLIAGVNPAFQKDSYASSSFSDTKAISWVSEPQLTYSLNYGKHYLNVITGATFLMNKNDNQLAYLGGIQDDALVRNPLSATSYYLARSGNLYKYVAVFGRASYDFNDKYLLNFTFRRDGSSRFGPRKKFANFGSLAIGWLFSEEQSVKSALPFLSFGKVRASYGFTGNDQIGDYQYLNRYEFTEQTYAGQKGLRVIGLYNPDFAWERTQKGEIGLELGFLDDRILLTSSFYNTRSSNQLLAYTLPIMTGSSTVTGNRPAKIQNTGFEIVINTQNVKHKNFDWSSSLNFSIARNKLLSYSANYFGSTNIKAGQSLLNRYLYKVINVDNELGNFQFADGEGKPVPPEQADIHAASIDLNPCFYGGFQNTVNFKNFRLDVLFQFVKQNGPNGVYDVEALPGTISNQPIYLQNRWRNPGDIAAFQRVNQDYSLSSNYQAFLNSDQTYGDASFIRCKNIMFSWTTPPTIVDRIHLKGLRLYLQGQNIFTITKYKGWDPETQSVKSIPPLRVITGGLQFTL